LKNNQLSNYEIAFSHLDGEEVQPEKLTLYGKELNKGQFGFRLHPVIYPSSLVMLSPRWSQSDYAYFYECRYDELYRLDLKPDIGVKGIENNSKEIIDRLMTCSELTSDSITNIIDLGAGPGFGLPLFCEAFPMSNISVVEGSPAAREIVKKNNFATVVGNFVDNDLAKEYSSTFDLIIMRHVVEHFLSPVGELKWVHQLLVDDGLCYIAVPDMMHPRTKLRDYKYWWEYWFRSVHCYYYNRNTLFKTLSMAGLKVILWGEENEEIWCIVKKRRKNESKFDFDYRSSYKKQKDIIMTLLP